MQVLGPWILYFLLLGDRIDGVNRENLRSLIENDYTYKDILSKEVVKILNFHNEISNNIEDTNRYGVHPGSSSSRHSRSVPVASGTLCSPWDSCVSRCGQKPKALPYTCNCDSVCSLFSDCCSDYKEHCYLDDDDQQLKDKTVDIPEHKCEILYMRYNVLAVGQCPAHYEDIVNRKLCSVKMPKECVFLDTYNASAVEQVYTRCKQTVHQKCISKFRLKCNEMVEPRCTSVMSRRCNKHASSVCRKCGNSFWPVADTTGIIYRNSFCALCNFQKKHTLLSPHILNQMLKHSNPTNASDENLSLFVRRCAPDAIDSCHNPKDGKDYHCTNYSGAVVTKGKRGKIYKNLRCAECNGESKDNLVCGSEASLMRGLIRPLLENFITGDEQGILLDDIPAAFSILLNFGLDGRERMYFSSEGEEDMRRHQARCGQGRIWDPFSEVCRKLYCSTEFILVDYRCVRKETPEEPFNHENETSVIPDARTEFVHLTLSAEMEMLDFLQFNGLEIETIRETLRVSLANSFSINIERIRNVLFNISVGGSSGTDDTLKFIEEMDDMHPITFKIDFDLFEDIANVTASEPSVDSIVSMLASSLSMNGFEFDINNVTSRIFEIHQTVSPLTSWCNSAIGGEKKEYWNSEFSLTLKNEEYSPLNTSQITGIYVNKTGKFYPSGKFVADILFQGYQFSGNLINVSGVAVVCESRARLNASCMRIIIHENEYVLENGTLSIHNASLRNIVDDSNYEKADNGSLWICLKSLQTNPYGEKYHIELNIAQALVSYVLLWISVIATATVLMTYTAFGSLRNLPGCNTMNLTFSLMAMQITFIFGQRSTVTGTACMIVGHILHYEILCCFMWMNVMAFDLFRTFGNSSVLSNIRSKRRFLPRYMAYAYFSPVTIITASSLLDCYLSESPFAPHYGADNICWITSNYSAVVFFATPLALIMCVNFIFFVLTILAMRSVKNVVQLSEQKSNHNGRNDVFLYAKMALVIGLTWALSFAAAFVKGEKLAGQILTYLFIIFNTLQGVFVFWVFVCNKKVYNLYKEFFRNTFRKISKKAKYNNSFSAIRHLTNVMRRTVSTDTVISTISNTGSSCSDSRLSIIPEFDGDSKR